MVLVLNASKQFGILSTRIFIILFFVLGNAWSQTPDPTSDTIQSDTIQYEFFIVKGDTVMREMIDLEEVLVLGRIKFKSDLDRRKYLILRRKTRKVYPYAKLASERLLELQSRLDQIKSKRDRKKYTKIVQDYIEDQFSAELKKLTRTEGQILVKLIHRQTGVTAYSLIKDLKSGWRAFWYNSTASMFNISLKEEFNPEFNQEDYLIEDILQRSFQSNILVPQESRLKFNFHDLTNKWVRR